MEENYDIIKYYNVLNRLSKKTANYEGLIMIKKQYFTDNFYYYLLCLLTRFIPLIALSGDYSDIYIKTNNVKSFQSYLKLFSCHSIMKGFNLSQEQYSILSIIITILYVIRSLMNFYIINQVKNARENEKWPLPNKYMIIMDHIAFLLFPYIIEFLSFIFYIIFFPKTFIIRPSNEFFGLTIFGAILNLIIIIGYNIDNYFYIICSNRKYTITLFDAYFSEYNEKEINKKVSYKCPSHIIYLFIFLQNFVLFLTIENYFNRRYKLYFKIVCSILLFISILILYFSLSNTFNYSNYINLSISVLFFFCFYSIILDLVISITKNLFKNGFNQVMYILLKLVLSYISHILCKKRTNKFLEKKITEILFQVTNNKKQKHFVNGFFYLHEVMLKVKRQKNIESAFFFVKFLYNHVNNCSKLICNCKLLKALNIKEYISSNDESNSEDFISNLIIILNYLFESAFIDYDFYNNLDLVLILSEHFCHLKNNPIMAFSFIKTYLLKQKNKLSKFQIVSLHELAQKYSYYITSKVHEELEKDLKEGKYTSLINRNKSIEFKNALIILKITFDNKKFFTNYINIQINLIKYRSIFEESLSFQFDENNEYITSIKTNFFEDKTKIEGFFNDIYDVSNNEKINGKNNLYSVIYLLSKERIYYNRIIKSIKILENLNIPIFHLFKYFLFFDFFQGGNLPNEIIELLNKSSFKKEMNLYNSYITTNEYSFLKRKYNEENNKIDSTCHLILEYKKDLRIKYFTESFGLKLGYKQKDLVNSKLDVLVPNDFYESHHNMIKHIVTGNQIRHYLSKNNYIFDSTSKILYPMDYEGLLIYNICKHLVIILKSNFVFDNEYSFMLNNNFELLSNSINFQDEYYLNQKILQTYNISLMDLLKIKQDKIRAKFENEYKRIQLQKLIRKIKTEEYFIPQFYAPSNMKFIGMMNPKYYNTSKNNYLSNIRLPNDEGQNENATGVTQEDDEKKNLIKNNHINNSINDLLLETENIIFHKTFTTTLNKGTFIENLAKELTNIPDNDLIFENDKTSYNCIISAKNLISKLLTKSEIANEYLKILVKLTFIYDKPFYFIKINDEKKQYLTISKNIHFGSNKKNIVVRKLSSQVNNKIRIPLNKKDNNSRNKTLFPKKKSFTKKERIITENNNNNNEKKNLKTNETSNNIFINKIVKKIQEYKVKINRDKLILSIKVIVSIIILIILILYIIINNIQGTISTLIKEILLTYFYNGHTRDTFICINSKILQIYYDYSNLARNELSDPAEYQSDIIYLSNSLKDNFHNFTQSYVNYNLLIGHNLNSLYKLRKFYKIKRYWKEIIFESDLIAELNYIIYFGYTINISGGTSPESQLDFKNFFNFKERTKEKINTNFIKLLYYFCVNLENYQIIFQEIDDEVYNSYKVYLASKMILHILLGIFQILLYIFFFSVIIYYLYYCNEIIFKNIVFLFLDLSEQEYDKNNINNKLIRLKLDEFKSIIEDFDLNKLEKYSKNIDNLERNKLINLRIQAKNNDILENNREQGNNDNIINKKTLKSGLKGEEKENSSKNIINEILNDNHLNIKGKGILNNSSQNYLVNTNSNNKILKNSINNNSMNASNEFLMNSNTNNSKRNFYNQSLKNINIKEKDINGNDTEEKYQDLILDKLNKSQILMMKVFLGVTLLLLVLILFFDFFSMYEFSNYINLYSHFFQDFSIISNRYTQLFYFYNALRMLIITPNIEANLYMVNLMEILNDYYEEQNNKFNEIMSSINNYDEIKKLYYILTESQSYSTQLIKEKICEENQKCNKYLESQHNIVDSGIDFGFKTSITLIGNIYLDYKNLDDKKNLTKIESSIIKSVNSQFNDVAISLSNCFLIVKEKIFKYFFMDEENFRNNYMTKISNLKINLIFISIIILVFTIYAFITITGYIQIIKESSCRVNCSFFYIKNYKLK